MKNDLRHYVRKFVHRRAYRVAAAFADASAVIRREGFATFRTLRQLDGSEIALKLKGLRHPFIVPRTAGFVGVVIQNIVRREYDSLLPENPKVIIDGGACLADVSCLWASRFPDARIVAMEPSPVNFRLTERNAAPYGGQITPLALGLWERATVLGGGGEEQGFTLSADSPGAIEVIDIATLRVRLGLNRIDLLKLDVEGAEDNIVGSSIETWIDSVGRLIIECHGPAIERRVVGKLHALGFGSRRHRSLIGFDRAWR